MFNLLSMIGDHNEQLGGLGDHLFLCQTTTTS
jgi:hypothetical protein